MTKLYTTEELIKMKEEAESSEREYTTEELMEMKNEGLSTKQFEQDSNVADVAKGIVAGGVKGATAGFADEIAGALASVWAMKSGRSPEEAYKEVRDKVRNWDKEWRDGAPVTAFLAELGASAANPALKAGGLLKTFIQAGVYGLGESDAEDLATNLAHAGISAVGGTAAHGLMRGAGMAIRKPTVLRGRTTGFKPEEFISTRTGKMGPKGAERKVTDIHTGTEHLNKRKFFASGSHEYDVKTDKWVPDKTPIRREKSKLQSFHDRTFAMTQIKDTTDNLLRHYSKGKTVPNYTSKYFKLDSEFKEIIRGFPLEGIGPTKGRKKIAQVVEDIYDTIDNTHGEGSGSTLLDLNSIKSKLQQEVQWDPKGDLPPETKRLNTFYTKMSRFFRKKIQSEMNDIAVGEGGKQVIIDGQPVGDFIERANKTSQYLNAQNKALSAKLGIADYGGHKVPTMIGVGPAYTAGKIGEATIHHPEMMMKRARAGEIVEKIPERGRDIMRDLTIQAPYKGVPKLLERPPEEGRKPQSLPDMLIDTPIKRETSEFMNNKDFVKMKIAQQAPDLLPGLTVGMEGDPRMMEDILPVLPTIMPSLFEYDKYNRFDGKIMDPQMREKATKDTMARDDLSNTEKIMIISQMNRNGEFAQ